MVTTYDMNVLLTTLFARAELRQTDAAVPLCLPGVADDGYLSLAIKYATPNICVIYATLKADDHPENLAKVNAAVHTLETRGLLVEITKALHANFLRRTPVVPSRELCGSIVGYGVDVALALVKENATGQMSTFNVPVFALTQTPKRMLRKLQAVYAKSEEPSANPNSFEYLLKNDNEIFYVNRNEKVTVVFMAERGLPDQSLGAAYERMWEKIIADPVNFFIPTAA
jgi:hypothetical protein